MKIKELKTRMTKIIRESGQKNPLVVVTDNGFAENIGAFARIDETNKTLIIRMQKRKKGKTFKETEIPIFFIHLVRHITNEEAAMLIEQVNDLMSSY